MLLRAAFAGGSEVGTEGDSFFVAFASATEAVAAAARRRLSRPTTASASSRTPSLRWRGSSTNWQPWHFHVLRDPAIRARLAELAPYARHVAGAALAIAIVMPGQKPEWECYDEGRVAERILVAAGVLGLGAGIGWVMRESRAEVGELIGLTESAYVRTVISIGHPMPEAARPKSAPGKARKPPAELVVDG